jgi:hypothetical protein
VLSGFQCIRAISNTDGYPTILLPLSVVIFIAGKLLLGLYSTAASSFSSSSHFTPGIFKSLEDLRRHRADREANSSEALVLARESPFNFVQINWADLQVVTDYKVMNLQSHIDAILTNKGWRHRKNNFSQCRSSGHSYTQVIKVLQNETVNSCDDWTSRSQ